MSYILVFLFGLVVGSFLNVIIHRLETKEPIIKSRSHCPDCGAVLKWYDNIPLISFIFLRGKCRYCQKRISWQYPLVELTAGLLSVAVFNNFNNLLVTGYWLLVTYFLIIIFVYDLKHYIIPDRIIYPAIIVALLYSLFMVPDSLFNNFLPAFGASAFFLALVLVSKGQWMGLGDVKLAFLMGLILGWPNILLALFLAFLSGAIIGLALVIFGKKGLKSQIPFGPFLSASTIVILLSNNFLTIFLDKV